MHVLSVNIGQADRLQVGAKAIRSGIGKQTQAGRVPVGALGLSGDHVMNTKHHGGPDQAVYLYSAEDYAWWAGQLGVDLAPGTFGENLTLSAFGGEVRVGDRYQVGGVLLEATAPRIPCATLAARMGEPNFVKLFKDARRPGFYARVLEGGEVGAGDPVAVERRVPDLITITELFDLAYRRTLPPELLERVLRAPISIRLRQAYGAQRMAGTRG